MDSESSITPAVQMPAASSPVVISKNMSSKVFSSSTKTQKNKMSKLLLAGFDGLRTKWPPVSPELSQSICDSLTKMFWQLNYKHLSCKERKMLKRKDHQPEELTALEACKSQAEVILKMKENFVFGINEVTKGLERNRLRFVLVDRSVKPFSIINHIPDLAVAYKIPAVAVDGLAIRVGLCIGINSLVAFGFKNPSSALDGFVEPLISLVPELSPCAKHEFPVSTVKLDIPESGPTLFADLGEPDVKMEEHAKISGLLLPVDIKIKPVVSPAVSYKGLMIKSVAKNDNRVLERQTALTLESVKSKRRRRRRNNNKQN